MSAKVIADTLLGDIRVTSLEVEFPRFLLPQFNTHRVASKNFASSRAIPNKRAVDLATYTPSEWRLNKPGMQSDELASPEIASQAQAIFEQARQRAIESSQKLAELGIAKEQVNRIIEPYMYVKGIVTSTYWENFFSLRHDKHAQKDFYVLAGEMKEALDFSTPIQANMHLPYNTGYTLQDIKVSVARCARVSYLNFDGKSSDLEKDLKLYEKLVIARPKHSSSAEHQAMTVEKAFKLVEELYKHGDINFYRYEDFKENYSHYNGNFHTGIVQYRKLIEDSFSK